MFKNLSIDSLAISGRQSEVIELALSFQFKSMDLNIVDFAQQVDSSGIDHARRLIDSAQIRIGQFSVPSAWLAENDETGFNEQLDQITRYGELAAAVGCSRCVTHVMPATDDLPYHENFERHRYRLRQMSDRLAPHEIQLGVGFLAPERLRESRAFQFIHTFDAVVKLAESTGADNIGVVVDTWHMHVGGATLAQVQDLTAADIVSVYLSDAPTGMHLSEVDQSDRLMPGETGAIDCVATLTALAELGFGGPISVRASRTGLDALRRDEIVRLAGERLGQLWKAAGLGADGTLTIGAKQ